MNTAELTRRSLVAAAGAAALAAARKPRPLKLMLTGQCLILHDICARPWPGMAAVEALLARADVCVSDLEVVTRNAASGAPTREPELLHAASPEALDCLKRLNFTLLSTANNHAYDLGSGGVLGTLAELDARGLSHAGSGRTLAEAAAPGIRSTPHGKVALVGMATGAVREGGAATPDRPGVNEVRRGADGVLDEGDVARVLDAVKRASRQADVTVLCHHNHYWEPRMQDVPAWQRLFAHRAIDAGANVFLGHGAPVLQATETYRRRPIFYGLGNFIFQTATKPGKYPPESWNSVIAECDMHGGEMVSLALHPVTLNEMGAGGETDLETRGRPSISAPA